MKGYRLSLFGDDDMKDVAELSHNTEISFVQGYQAYVTQKGLDYFATGRWENLVYINLSYFASPAAFRMGSKGCKILSKVSLPKIDAINLQFSLIDANGLWHLSKAKWGNLQQLSITFSKVGVGGLQRLVRGNWKQLVGLNFLMSQVTDQDVKQLLLSNNGNLILGFGNDHIKTSDDKLISIFSMKQYRLVTDNET